MQIPHVMGQQYGRFWQRRPTQQSGIRIQ